MKPLLLIALWACGFLLNTFFDPMNAAAAAANTNTPPTPFHRRTVRNYITNRCQNPLTPSPGIWSWEGRLVDPANGNVIANVEGIELVRKLSEIERPAAVTASDSDADANDNNDNSEERTRSLWRVARGIRRLHDLKVKHMLTSDKHWDYAGTILCRKLFCYSAPQGPLQGLLLKQYKHHPTAPMRNIHTEEAVALYDTATTFISREGGREMEVVTEWPDGSWVQSGASAGLLVGAASEADGYYTETTKSKTEGKPQKKFPFGFTVYVKRSGKGQIPSLPKQVVPLPSSSSSKRNGRQLSGLPRSKFIQFGKDDDAENRRFGARETYSYMMGASNNIGRSKRVKRAGQEIVSNLGEKIGLFDFDFDTANGGDGDDDSSCTVHYTRYGEAPPFYAPGKMCTLELLGRRISSVTDAPPLAATIAASRVPGFMSVHTPIAFGEDDTVKSQRKRKRKRRRGRRHEQEQQGLVLDQAKMAEQMVEDTAAINAVKWFRGDDGSLPLQIIADGDNEEEDLMTKVVNEGLNAIQRIRAATTLSAATEH